ncbi:hypothetical protein KIW84_054197 [Lathyrus oleraceus]|uniref:Decapping nuclease n=1 Tax=Pisum sativum TaxID=3888 RepID=A0A9D5AH70_PEA|nr:hypothetical protein KIW84_054197 [Pisum sativum]
MRNYWQRGVRLAFVDEVLCWLYGTVKENEDYTLQFAPPFHRLELLQTQSCPDVITSHLELLTIFLQLTSCNCNIRFTDLELT